jgi:hypothetical protein
MKLVTSTISDLEKHDKQSLLGRARDNDAERLEADQDGSVLVLGCGAPLGSVIGHVHLNRISADAGLTWYSHFNYYTINLISHVLALKL